GPNVIYDAESNQDAEDKVIELIEQAQKLAEDTMLEYKDFLVDLSNYLSKHSSIKKDELKEMASKYVDVSDLKTRETYYDFRD
ncbi:hypothetical protein ACI4CV_27905, partial [Klebsiella pneumoniae]|uniref:hypothetical protein n=1 Tax=Klebsiella pneumoniae TaxID=573 RepID=UPI003854FA4F